eukprot:CAMPEP_0182454186 /NCGR_PEP_ID=MMETSP1319-20130603/931_1 /TAXON_ID=172717 /ORGANISM="Bolidomonas pacifica, Strain RCC208" /LENGTH=102 /DNA_ID=CAMNT_0024652175 /DNA_START=45 /DNA_END=350 /DNA_ORIENTATION=-
MTRELRHPSFGSVAVTSLRAKVDAGAAGQATHLSLPIQAPRPGPTASPKEEGEDKKEEVEAGVVKRSQVVTLGDLVDDGLGLGDALSLDDDDLLLSSAPVPG